MKRGQAIRRTRFPGWRPRRGRVTIHRLNNAEYNNTVRDLLGTSLRPADDFPSDDRGFGSTTSSIR